MRAARPNWSEDDLKAAYIRMGKGGVESGHKGRKLPSAPDLSHARPSTVEGTRKSPSPTYRSKLESAWANHLDMQVVGGEIARWWFEPLNLRLPGKKNFYKPDFLVLAGDGLTFYEVKGRNPSDDRSLVKIKTAAGITPWAKFVLVKRVDGTWDERTIT